VIHLAWQGVTNTARNDPEQITQNVPGMLVLCDAAHKAGCRCWVGIGSQAEYGSIQGVLTEDLPLHPSTAYGSAKLAAEMLTQKLCELYGVRFVWFRLLATYGPQDDQRHLIPSVIQKLLRGERPSLTAGGQRWDYLYITDAAEAIVRVVSAQVHGVFNLASGEAVPVRYIVERIRDLIDPALPLGFGELPYPPDQVMRLQANISKLTLATDWKPQVCLEEGLARTVDWHRKLYIRNESSHHKGTP
jgi:UDP-glucose 4-epimerase